MSARALIAGWDGAAGELWRVALLEAQAVNG